jgi:hypothetical protein
MAIPEKGRKGLRVKMGDKLQYEVEEYRATVLCIQGFGHSRGPSPAISEQECLSPISEAAAEAVPPR